MKTFLVPTDYSKESHKALGMALQLASHTGAQVLLCYAYQPPVLLATDDGPVFALPQHETEREALSKLRKYVRFVRRSASVSVPMECTVMAGGVAEGLLELVKDREVSMVVMGTKGYTSFLDKVFGTTTEGFVHLAPCPVLVVPLRAEERLANTMVYASALKISEADALQVLKQVKDVFNVTLTVLHVDKDGALGQVNVAVIKNTLLRDFAEGEVSFAEVKSKRVVEGIIHYVAEHKPAFVAFSVTEHGLMRDLFHSTTTSLLLQHLHTPMLALPKLSKSNGFAQKEEKLKPVK